MSSLDKIPQKFLINFSDCYSKTEARPCEERNGTWFNQTCYNETEIESRDVEVQNVVENHLRELLNKSVNYQPSPSEEYFK